MRRLVFVLAAALAPVPAQAADLATLGCVEEKMPVTIRAQLLIDAERNLNETGVKPTYDSSVVEGLKATVVECATEHGWPQSALQSATLYARARVAWPVAQRLASEKGLDPAVLETVWLGLPEEQRNAPLTVETYRQLADAAIPEGELRTREMGEFISEFFQLLSVMQYSSYAFSQD